MNLFGWRIGGDHVLELVVLAGLIYLFLRFLRQTRGNRVVRGLVAALLLGTVVLYGMSVVLDLDQLTWLLDRVAGFAVVILAIIFQPELRRAMAQLGAKKRTKDTLSKLGGDTLEQIGAAVRNLADSKTGALIAIEGETPLDVWIDRGQSVQAPVRQLLLQSLFAPDAALHDGAVLVRGDRVEAAACFLPLSDDLVLDATTGTRHRAALGLAEETDATTIVVSEETGRISICRGGKLTRGVAPELFESELRETLGPLLGGGRRGRGKRSAADVLAALRSDLSVLGLSVLIAAGLLGLAYFKQSKSDTVEFDVRIVQSTDRAVPEDGELLVRLPDDQSRVLAPPATIEVELSGTRSAVEAAVARLRGRIELAEFEANPVVLSPEDVLWEPSLADVASRWTREQPLVLQVEQNRLKTFQPGLEHLTVDVSDLDGGSAVDLDTLRFEPPLVSLVGPAEVLDALEAQAAPVLLFEPLRLTDVKPGLFSRNLELAEALRQQGLSLRDAAPVRAMVDVRPFERRLGPIEREVALVSLDPARADLPQRWTVPDLALRQSLWIETSGLLPAGRDPSSPQVRYISDQILQYVEDHLRVYVDLAELPEGGESRTLELRIAWSEPFRDALQATVGGGDPLPDWVDLRAEFTGDRTVRVEPRADSPGEDL